MNCHQKLKNKSYKILQGCNNTVCKNAMVFIWSHDLAVVRICEENKSQCPETM